MDPTVLRRTWALALQHGERLVLHFYATLFSTHPESRGLFGTDMREQRSKLAATLSLVVRSVDDLDKVRPVLERLGAEHRRFGATEEHYLAVGEALLATLEHFLGDAWTDDAAKAWDAAYTVVANIMIDAARAADQRDVPAWWDCRILFAEPNRARDRVYLAFQAPDLGPITDGLTVPAALHGAPGDWLTITPFPVDGGWATYIDVTDDPRTLALAQARPGDTLRLGAPLPVDPQEAQP